MRPFWPSCHVFDTLVLHNSLVFAVLYCLCLCKIKKISFLITDKVFDHRAQPLDACFKHFLTADLTSHFTCQVCNSREKILSQRYCKKTTTILLQISCSPFQVVSLLILAESLLHS